MDAAIATTQPIDTTDGLVAEASAALAAAGVGTARLDAEVLLAAACSCDRTSLYARGRDAVPAGNRDAFRAMLARRLRREPLQYIVSHQEFWSLDFVVTPDVLIPRPETERLVELVLALQLREFAGTSTKSPLTICDLGTGSGCIAIALARELPPAVVWALDTSPAALAVAEANARRHAVAERVHFVASDLFAAVGVRRFDIIASNPPYVPSAELQCLQPELSWEPRSALDGGATGLDVIGTVLPAAREHLVDGGWLIMEIGAEQAPAVQALARAARFQMIDVRRDYAGLPRVLMAQR